MRAEYPLAVHRLKVAIAQAKDYGVLGENILGLRLQLRHRAGRGRRCLCVRRGNRADQFAGRPRRAVTAAAALSRRTRALWGYPTNINNVETWFNIAPIIAKGPAWFTGIGSEASSGTKVFSLVGKVMNTGLVEMPLGTPLSRFVYDVGGGSMHGHNVKAVQTGGPSGGCIPHEHVRHAGRL